MSTEVFDISGCATCCGGTTTCASCMTDPPLHITFSSVITNNNPECIDCTSISPMTAIGDGGCCWVYEDSCDASPNTESVYCVFCLSGGGGGSDVIASMVFQVTRLLSGGPSFIQSERDWTKNLGPGPIDCEGLVVEFTAADLTFSEDNEPCALSDDMTVSF